MKKVSIYFGDDSKAAEMDHFNRCYRSDVFVQIDELLFNVVFFDPDRLVEEFHLQYERQGFYDIDPNLVLLKDITTEAIIKTTLALVEKKYFEYLGVFNENLKYALNIPRIEVYKGELPY